MTTTPPKPLAAAKPRTPREIETDELALHDALNAIATWPETDAAYIPTLHEQAQAIRRRLPDKGASVDRERTQRITFERGRPSQYDPPASTRLRRVNAPLPAEHEFPRGPLNGGAAAAIAATLATLTALGIAA